MSVIHLKAPAVCDSKKIRDGDDDTRCGANPVVSLQDGLSASAPPEAAVTRERGTKVVASNIGSPTGPDRVNLWRSFLALWR